MLPASPLASCSPAPKAPVGVEGDEAVHSLVDAMYGHLPYTVVQHGVRIHPTVSELIPTMLGELTPLR